MAKAILAASRSTGTWFVAQVFPDGTDMTKVASPAAGQLLIKWRDGEPSVGDDLTADAICVGLATIISTITTINWTQVKAAIN
jgi:hypothetical protein